MPSDPRSSLPPATTRIGLSRPAQAALALAFLVLVGLLGLMTVTLISQRQRTVQLNHQLGALVAEATYVLDRAKPALGALPGKSGTIRSRAAAASALVAEARPLVAALSTSNIPGTVRAADELLAALARPNGLATTLSDLDALLAAVRSQQLVPRAAAGLDALLAIVRLRNSSSRCRRKRWAPRAARTG